MSDFNPDDWHHDRVVSLVIEDLSAALSEAFPTTLLEDAFRPAPGLEQPISSEAGTAVAWEYHGNERHNPLAREGFWGSLRPVVVRGVTVVTGKEGEELFHRYIDWAGVYDQLGMTPGRPTQGQVSLVGVDLVDGVAALVEIEPDAAE
jgi:hypothetical protein